MMLAYLHDPRAESALDTIGTPLPEEAWTLRRIRAAARPVIACDVKSTEGQLTACLFNASTKPTGTATLQEIQDTESQSPRQWPLPHELPVHDGMRLTWPLEGPPPGDLTVRVSP
ncbi:MAG: hypothetical protein R3B70_04945 [Polyangiaceae bacterium]